MKAGNVVPVLTAAAILGFLIYPRLGSRRAGVSGGGPPVSRLRLGGELKPLERRWLELDEKVLKLKPGDAGVDWPALLQEAMGLLEESAAVNRHFAQDMLRLHGEADPVTGIPHARFVEEVYGYADSLGRCALGLGGLVASLHRLAEAPPSSAAQEHRRQVAGYLALKRRCLEGSRQAAGLLEKSSP